MRSFRVLVGIPFLFILLAFPLRLTHATEYYAFHFAGSDCILCHNSPQDGSLNETGILFQERGYRYPLVWKQVCYYIVIGSVFLYILSCIRRRYRLWHTGRYENRWNQMIERGKGVLLYGFAHRTILRNPFPGMSHFLLFGSLLVLGIVVTVILAQNYFSFPFFNIRVINSQTYPWLRLTLDLCGIFGWAGTLLLAFRRYIQRPKELDFKGMDGIALALLFFVFLTGLSLTGTRNQLYQSPWRNWAPMASATGGMLMGLVRSQDGLETLYRLLGWGHPLLSIAFLAYIPFPKLFHLVASPLNIFFRNLEAKGALNKLDLEESETLGVSRIGDFTWRNLLEFDACTRCGRCQEACPAHLSQKHLNPKKVIQNLKGQMESPPIGRDAPPLIGGVVTEEEIWECTTCQSCLEHCPVFIEPMAKLIDFRRSLVLQHGKVPRETHFAFRNIERKGNPWGFESNKRMGWMKELGVREVSPGENVDILFWVGCYGSYDDRNIKVLTHLIKILKKAGLDFGVLGSAEWCCGIDLRRMGSEYLYQVNVKRNMDCLLQVTFQKILTACPHCFNTLKNEYRQFGARFEVVHSSHLVDQLIQQGKVMITPGSKETRVTYHDSCYLGRYNDGYEPPRRILRSIPDLHPVEMERSREKSFCCGGGGCHMWMEEKAGRRINQMRVEQATKTGAQIVATMCPLCLISLDSAVKVSNLDKEIRVMDILELVGERIE